MKWMDRWIQKQRIKKAICNIPPDSTVLDIGCFQGELFQAMGTRLRTGFGIDPLLTGTFEKPRFTLIKGNFPKDWAIKTKMNCVTMLAVLEHIPSGELKPMMNVIFDIILPGGLVILTVPSKKADLLLSPLKQMGIIRGMSLEEHYGFDPADTKILFEEAGFSLIKWQTFQAGLNNLFVFKRTE
jgi:2-polyprenyl-3-methyl-5-hydroxy-6-metoxy-1,4-benzoquinol methylase